MEEDILEKPCRTVLYRQSSIETVSSVSLNSLKRNSDEDPLPKIVDVKVKGGSEIFRRCDESIKDESQDESHSSMKNKKKVPPVPPRPKSDKSVKENLEDQTQDNVLNFQKKKPPPAPSKKKIQNREDGEYKESNVENSSMPNFLLELESKLSKQKGNSSTGPVYLEMKSPRSVTPEDHLDSTNTKSLDAEGATSRSKTKEFATKHNNPELSIYSEMKFELNSETIPEETQPENACVYNADVKGRVCVRYENVKRDIHNIYEELEDDDKDITPVALIKALKLKAQSKENFETIEIVDDNMATVRPKSPKPIISKNDKEESFWDKIGTLGRKKRIKEVQEVQEEGKYAIDSPGFAVTPYVPPEEYDLDENEERSIIMPKAYEDPRLKELIQVLIDWINDELASQRIIVQDLTEDLYDGQVFQKLFEMLTGHKLDVPEVTQSEEGQKQKLSVVLSHFNRVLGLPHIHNKWNVEVIHSKSIVPILHLLVALARHFRPPVRLPENVSVSVTVVQKTQGQLTHRIVREIITSEYSDVGMRCERDAFDTLFDHAPEKLQVVKKSMVTFVNKHLNKLNLEVTEIETQFHDGVYLIMLMGLLEGFFVPLYSFFPTPKDNDQKVQNVTFAFELMEEVGLARPKARPEDVVNLDLKSTLRVLYNLFNKYKSIL